MSPRLLIVDDDQLVTRAVVRGLQRAGWNHWRIVTSSTPVDPSGFDVALLDWSPHGLQMVRLCNARGVPFVILTGDSEGVAEQTPSGTIVLVKPSDPESIRAALGIAMRGVAA